MRLSASLYAADPLRLADDIAAVAPHVASLHIDVMDGHFAPAFGYDERLVARLSAHSALPIDVHLMVTDPEPWGARFAALGARSVAFHAEAVEATAAVARTIRRAGGLAYLALLPATPIAAVEHLLGAVDGILLLTAPPGGGPFDERALARVHELPRHLPSIVDGRIQPAHFGKLRAAGVDIAVLGRALFDTADLASHARSLNLLAA